MKKSLLFAALALGGALPFTQLPAAHAQGATNTFYELDYVEYEASAPYNESKDNYVALGSAASGVNATLRASGANHRGATTTPLPPTNFKTSIQWSWYGPDAPHDYGLVYTYSMGLSAGGRGGGTASGTASITIEGDPDEISITGSSQPSNVRQVVATKGFNRRGQRILPLVVIEGNAKAPAVSAQKGQEATFTVQSTVLATVTELDVTNANTRLETTNP